MKKLTQLTFFLIFSGKFFFANAQNLPVGLPALEDYYRRLQLTGPVDSTLSFTVRPLDGKALGTENIYDPDNSMLNSRSFLIDKKDEFHVQLMPLVYHMRYTSAYPIGWNDGGIIPAVGFQNYVSAGIYADYKWLSIQLRPEFITAQNRDYIGFDGRTEASWKLWYEYANNIDQPERFGNGTYTRILPGQSSIRVNYEKLSLGFSTENIWWGPGRRSSLLMSNTAPGFPHITLNTTQPIRSAIGSFEGQVIAGWLKGSGYPPTPLGNPSHYDIYYEPKDEEGRYFSGFILNYQPKWLDGLSIGASRTFVIDKRNLGNGLGDVLPFFRSRNITSINNPEGIQTGEQHKQRDEYKSVFARWVMPKGRLEFYVEYGRNDPGWDGRDRFVQMDHTRAYILGFRKLIPINSYRGSFVDFGFELTQMDRTRTSTIRESPSWYISPAVRNGYTHLGQVLGAGIGPGGSLQSFNIGWVKGLKRLSLQLERQEHQLDFFYEAVVTQGDFRKNWVDLSAKLIGTWDYKNMIFFGNLRFVKAFNYQYQLDEQPNPTREDFWNFDPVDKFNFQANLGVMYRF